MSRLDFVTIAIVAICLTALALLIVRVIRLTGSEDSELSATEVESEYDKYFDDDATAKVDTFSFNEPDNTTSFSDEEADRSIPSTENPVSNNSSESTTTATTATTAKESETLTSESTPTPVEEEVTSKRPAQYGQSEGQFMVIAGTYKVKANADLLVKKLQDAGYTNASSYPFDKNKYSVVIADRFEQIEGANAAVRELKKEHGIEAYVKKNE